ncbi:MAG: M48 family metallopeptidase [Muribaculaceae bacterium]|nr:M48 family metallopeptidase [Muribaculaceae bacterium]
MTYNYDTLIELPEVTISIQRQALAPKRIIAQARIPRSPIGIGAELDITSPEVQQSIGRIIMTIAHTLAPGILLPRAREIADTIGDQPAAWRISRGRRTLGTCNSRREISLSAACLFLPQHLRDYIVIHELAHLREMNHSPRFHALCNHYCNGREKELQTQLRLFKWPFPPRIRRQKTNLT